jgi:signal transduction histidine kinase
VPDPAQRAILHALECRARWRLGRQDEARRDCEQALELATRSSDDLALAAAHRMRGILIVEAGPPMAALPDFLATLAAAQRLGQDRWIAMALLNLGVAAHFTGVYSDAAVYFARALPFATRDGGPDLRALLGNNLGHLMVENGDPVGAIEQFRQALPLAAELRDAAILFNLRSGLGRAELARGDASRAVTILRETLADPGTGTAPWQIGETQFFLARAELEAGETRAAEASARAAVGALELTSPVRGYPAWATLVDVLAARGKLDEALRTVDQLLERVPAQARGRVEALEARARVLALRQAHRDAYEALQRAQRARQDQVSQGTRERMEYLRIQSEVSAREFELAQLRASQERQAAAAVRDRLTRNSLLALLVVLLFGAALASRILRARRQLETQIERSQHLDVLARLTGGVAHDFNNLMTVVCQSMHLLRLQPAVREAPAALELVDEAEDAARVGGRITQQLLAFARQQPMRPEIVRLQPFCAEHRGLFERSLGETMTLVLDLPEEALAIRVDRGQLTTAVMNLLVNSRDACEGRGVVTLKGERLAVAGRNFDWPTLEPGEYVALSVRDAGCGMTSEVLRNAITPFFTTRRDRGGTGLGLSMVDGFVEQSRGRLLLRSQPGAGATVSMVFPADG